MKKLEQLIQQYGLIFSVIEKSSTEKIFYLGNDGLDIDNYYEYDCEENNDEYEVINVELMVTSHKLGLNNYRLMYGKDIWDINNFDNIVTCLEEII